MLAILASAVAAVGTARAEVGEEGNIPFPPHVSIYPRTLPRIRLAPIKLQLGFKVPQPLGGREPVRLSGFELDLNTGVAIDVEGLPRCPIGELQHSSEKRALELCAGAEVGRGNLTTVVPSSEPDQEWEAINETVMAFNGRVTRRPSIILYGASIQPGGGHRTIAIGIRDRSAFTSLTSEIPPIAGGTGFFSRLYLTLGRRYRTDGTSHSFLGARCALPTGIDIGELRFGRWIEEFEGEKTVTETLSKTCKAKSVPATS
jgi:hypothetical protein